jgi:serine/threonine protein kinase/WD40 repeat protein
MESADQARREKALFEQALDLASAGERLAFLKGACGEDSSLQARVQVLLQAHDTAEGFLPDEPTGPTPFVSLSEKPGDRIGRYKLREKIGEGGCGVVYVAEQEEPVRRKVALKVIKLGMDTRSVIARFEAERQALAMMDHPNIAKVLDAGATESGRPYFVMELVRGVKITEYCDEQQLSMRERLELFIKVCQAVQHAHQKGIIHRDLKPSNILVTVNDGMAVPKVIDFGIAKATGGKLTDLTIYTDFHQFIGTPAYMSPEQATMTSLDIDTRSDIYTLGVLLYELLTGHTPFETKELLAQGVDAMRKTIRETEPVRPSTKLSQTLVAADVRLKSPSPATPDTEAEIRASSRRLLRVKETITLVRGDLDWIVMKCLEKDRARRYETANGLAFDLKRHLENEPVLARPPSVVYQFQKSFRRHKLVYSAAAAVLVALVVGLGSATIMFLRERAALGGEQQQRMQAQSAQKTAETERQYSRQLLYAADMNLAQQALNQNNLGEARRLLDRHRPQPGEEDLRGWEWRYLWQLTRSSALVTLTNRPVPGNSVDFSPDGTWLAVAWRNGRVDLWDVQSRQCVRTLTDREDLPRGHVAFSPVYNLLAATAELNTVRLYDLDSGRDAVLWRAPSPGEWGVRDLAFSQDGSKVVIYAGSSTRDAGDTVRAKSDVNALFGETNSQGTGDSVWVVNVFSSKIENRLPAGHSGTFEYGGARLSPNNQRLYLARSEPLNSRYCLQCIDLATSQEIWQTAQLRDYGFTTLAVSPDGRILASASAYEDSTIRLWDTATGVPLRAPLAGHTGWVSQLVFTKDGHRLISAAADQTIRFWDTGTWTESGKLCGHTAIVDSVAISETAQLIASTSMDGDLMLWNQEEPAARVAYRQLPEEVGFRALLPLDGSRVLVIHSNQPPELFDFLQGAARTSLPVSGLGSNTYIGTKIRNPWLRRWDGTNQILIDEWSGSQFIRRGNITVASGKRPTWVALNPARHLVAWHELATDKSVFIADLATPARRIELKSEIAGPWPDMFDGDGKYLVTIAQDRKFLRVWNAETGASVLTFNGFIRDEAFAGGGRVLVVSLVGSGQHSEIRFYDLDHPDEEPRRLLERYEVSELSVSPDGRLVAATSTGGSVLLCDPVTGESIGNLNSHMNGDTGLAFSKDGRRLLSSSGGREAVKLWDVATRQELLDLSGTGSVLQGVWWSDDGDTIIAGAPWQAWHAPSWAEIAATEAKHK